MNRLFWKILLGFHLSLLLTALGAGYVVHWYHQGEAQPGQRPGNFMTGVLAAVIQHEGAEGAKKLLEQCRYSHCPPLFVYAPDGKELLGRDEAQPVDDVPGATQQVTAPDGKIFRVVDVGRGPHQRFDREPPPDGFGPGFGPPLHASPPDRQHGLFSLPPFPFIHLVVGFLVSLLFSGAMAWYVTRPLSHLRKASHQLAEGKLATRVQPMLGSRRDEIAALGKDFDYMAERLQVLVGAQTQLLHDVSHELRTPLTRLRLAIGIARQQPEKFEVATERIERESERLDMLLGEILTLSRLDSGFHGEKTRFNLTELLVETVQDADFEARALGKAVAYLANGDVWVDGYPALIHRVLENIVRNAIKYTAEGSTVNVGMRCEAGRAHVAVSDHGPGIPDDDLKQIYKPFFRSRATAAKVEGYGLGLAIVKRAVEAHGGDILIRNQASGGLLVEISIPIAGGSASASHAS